MNNFYVLITIFILIIIIYWYNHKYITFENYENKIPDYNLLINGFPRDNAFQLHSRSNNYPIHLSTNNSNFYLQFAEPNNISYIFAFYDKYLYSITDGLFIDVVEPLDGSTPNKFVLTNNMPTQSKLVWRFVNGNLVFYFKNQKIDPLSKKYLPDTWTTPKLYYIHFDLTNNQMYVDNNKNDNELYLNVLKKNLDNNDKSNLLVEKIIYNKINQKYKWSVNNIDPKKQKKLNIDYEIYFPNKYKNQIVIQKTNKDFELFSTTNLIFSIQIFYKNDSLSTKKNANKSKSSITKPLIDRSKYKSMDKSMNEEKYDYNIENHKQYPQLVRNISKHVANEFGIYNPSSKLYYRCKDVIKNIQKPDYEISYKQVSEDDPDYIDDEQPTIQYPIQLGKYNYPREDGIEMDNKYIKNQIMNMTNRIDKRMNKLESNLIQSQKEIQMKLKQRNKLQMDMDRMDIIDKRKKKAEIEKRKKKLEMDRMEKRKKKLDSKKKKSTIDKSKVDKKKDKKNDKTDKSKKMSDKSKKMSDKSKKSSDNYLF
jgi:hypothetical protein